MNHLETMIATGTHTGHVNVYELGNDSEADGNENEQADSFSAQNSYLTSLTTKHPSFVLTVCFSNEPVAVTDEKAKNLLVAGNKDGHIAWFQCKDVGEKASTNGSKPSFDLLVSSKLHEKAIREMQFSVDSNLLFSAADDMMVKIVDVPSRNEISAFHGHRSWVMSVSPSLDGSMFCTGSTDKTSKLFDTKTGKILQTLENHSDQVCQVRWNKKGKCSCYITSSVGETLI